MVLEGDYRKYLLIVFNFKGGGAILRDPLFFHSNSYQVKLPIIYGDLGNGKSANFVKFYVPSIVHPKRSLETTLEWRDIVINL